ncbi:protein of unknown function (plasmid) [Cupriavidus taiwanensis]|uniref:Uncharacterized protein n=1 Tax=Cupriavidus taiwanensis TaxID=164546 RepID=A0A375IUA7_9BURK|nr:protein of unknown function [Cupriavidus taiwanensis]
MLEAFEIWLRSTLSKVSSKNDTVNRVAEQIRSTAT